MRRMRWIPRDSLFLDLEKLLLSNFTFSLFDSVIKTFRLLQRDGEKTQAYFRWRSEVFGVSVRF